MRGPSYPGASTCAILAPSLTRVIIEIVHSVQRDFAGSEKVLVVLDYLTLPTLNAFKEKKGNNTFPL